MFLKKLTDSTEFTIASTVIKDGRNLRLPSPDKNNGYVNLKQCIHKQFKNLAINRTEIPNLPASSILSLQINPPLDRHTLERHPIMIMFDVVSH